MISYMINQAKIIIQGLRPTHHGLLTSVFSGKGDKQNFSMVFSLVWLSIWLFSQLTSLGSSTQRAPGAQLAVR